MERLPCSRMAEQSASVDDSPRWLACGRMRGSPRGGSSAGRASRSQCEGREFDPPPLHQIALKRNGPLSRPVRVMEAPIYLPAPGRVAQRELVASAPVLAEPLGLLPMLLPLLPPMGLPVVPPTLLPALPPTLLPVLPPTLLPVLLPLPMLPLGLDDVCAIAPKAKRAAAVALTNSFNLMNCSCN